MIIDNSTPHELGPGCECASSKHKRTAGLAERVGHLFAGSRCLLLSEYGQIVLPPSKSSVCVEGGEVCSEHGS